MIWTLKKLIHYKLKSVYLIYFESLANLSEGFFKLNVTIK